MATHWFDILEPNSIHDFKEFVSVIKKNLNKDKKDNLVFKTINTSPSKLFKEYLSNIIDNFENILKSPYNLDKKDFVENIDFDYKILGKNIKLNVLTSRTDFVNIVKDFLFLYRLPILMFGNYGMGKSTVAKYLSVIAIEKNILPIFIELRNLDLQCINTDNTDRFISSIIDIAFKNYIIEKNDRKNIIELFIKKQIIIILDGVDESIIKNNKTLSKLIEFIIFSELPIYISCRLEYTNFISLYNSKIGDGNFEYKGHLNITLKNWNIKQWKSYQNKLLKKNEFKNFHKNIKDFFFNVYNGQFGDIPQRPLFLKMLTKLKIEKDILNRSGKSHYTLNEILSSNRSEIYYKYIRWQLFNDLFKHESNEYIDKDGNLNTKTNRIIDALIELLSYIAVHEYHMILKEKESSVSMNDIFNFIENIDIDKKYLTKEFIENVLEETSLFAILQRNSNSLSFKFSHKSFMEYLVSYRLVKSIFIERPRCDEVWGYYQTHEISQHFTFEVQRVIITKWLSIYPNDKKLKLNELELKTKNYRNKFLEKVFTDILLDSLYTKKIDTKFYHHLDLASERFEEGLFYIGRFKLENNKKILSILQDIFDDMTISGKNYHPVYYRTVSLALAQIKGMNYCNKYIDFLLEDYKTTSKKHFNTNLYIQKNYYGGDKIMFNKLTNYINQFLASDTILRNIITNDILTYFTLSKNNNSIKNNYIKKIITKSKILKESKLEYICIKIQKTFV